MGVSTYGGWQIVISFLSLTVLLVAVIIGFNCIWRTKHMLSTAMKLFVVAALAQLISKMILIFGLVQITNWYTTAQYFDLVIATFLMLGFVEMYKIIRRLDGEAPPQK